MVTVFRLQQKRFLKEAYSGFGAKLKSGRWNECGKEAVYTSGSRSLCALEVLVQADLEDMPVYVCVPANIPKDIFGKRTIVDQSIFPGNWRSYPPPPILPSLGAHWLKQGKSAVLEVPSAIIPEERNFILNPAHADFGKIEICKEESFAFDSRLLKKM